MRKIHAFLIPLLSATLSFSSPHMASSAQPPNSPGYGELATAKAFSKEEQPSWIAILAGGVAAESASGGNLDVRLRIARNLQKVLKREMTPDVFYRELGGMEMPNGLEPRHVLMQVKRDLIRYRGDYAKNYLGVIFPTGGSSVEVELLNYRRKVVFNKINEVIKEFRGRDVVTGSKWSLFASGNKAVLNDIQITPQNFKMYFSGVGSWMDEDFVNMKFAGDIDFSFMSGNLELAMAMKKSFDAKIKAEIGMTAEHFDTPCTAHGLADAEVFIGKHGQAFAEDFMRGRGTVKRLNPEQTLQEAQEVSTKDAFIDMFIDAKFSVMGLVDLASVKWPTEPAISMEMIRHFEHDVMGKDVFSELESYMKAAKYLERSNKAVEQAGGQVKNQALKEFCDEMIANKKAPLKTHAEIIRRYYQRIKKPIPVEVQLGPSHLGKTEATVKANDALIKEFFSDVKSAMWDNAYQGFQKQVSDLNARISAIDQARSPGQVLELEVKIDQLREMMEVEMRVLQDSQVGVHEIPGKFTDLMTTFRKTVKQFYKTCELEFPDMKDNKSFKFIGEMLKAGKPTNIDLAVGMILETTGSIHKVLDTFDDVLFGHLRGERGEWKEYLLENREIYWRNKVDAFLSGGDPLKSKVAPRMAKAETITQQIEININKIFLDNCAMRKVRQVNEIFGHSIQTSKTGQAMIKGLVAINVMRELPAYADAFYEDGWNGLITEFFRRRVPLGAAVENVVLGRYYRAAWDTAIVFIPPLALGEAAVSLGQYFATVSWERYWSGELDFFMDDWYASAQFVPAGYEEIGETLEFTNWELIKVSFKGKEINVWDFIQMKEKQISELKAWLSVPHIKREGNFPIEYTLDGFTKDDFDDWMRYDELLRENIYSQDPFLLMIDEMKKEPHVGPKLLDHYRDIYFTRREELRLDFFKHMKNTLEERKRAEAHALSGNLSKIIKELDKVAEELKIKNEMDEELEKEMGGMLWSFYAWIRDFFKGMKRGFMGQPDIWSNYEECTRIAQKYLVTYKKILQTREQAEQEYYFKEPWDFEARLLTGKWFLKGKESYDVSRYQRWGNLREGTETLVQMELEAIKAKYVDDSALDLKEGSFDQKSLGAITDHDMWHEVWKHIESVAGPEYPGFLKMTYEAVKEAALGAEKGPDMRQLARQHQDYHKRERDRLAAEFEEYYFNREDIAMDELQKLAADADKLAALAVQFCETAAKKLTDANAKLDGVEAMAKEAEVKLADLEGRVKDSEISARDIISLQEKVEKSGIQVGDIAHDIEKKALDVCETLASVKNAFEEEDRQFYYNKCVEKMQLVKVLLKEGKKNLEDVKSRGQEALEKWRFIEQTRTELEEFKALEQARKDIREADQSLTAAADALINARDKTIEIQKIMKKSNDIAVDIRAKVHPIIDTAKGKDIISRMQAFLARIELAYARAQECPERNERPRELAEQKLKKADETLKKMEEKYKQLLDGFKDKKLLLDAQQKTETADAAVKIAEAYMTRIEKAAMDAAFCLTLAEELLSKKADEAQDKPAWARSSELKAGEEKKPGGGYELISYVADTDSVEQDGYEYQKLKHGAAATVVIRENGVEKIIEGSRAVDILMEKKYFYQLSGVGIVFRDRVKIVKTPPPLPVKTAQGHGAGVAPAGSGASAKPKEVSFVAWYAENIGYQPIFISSQENFEKELRGCHVEGGGGCENIIKKVKIQSGPDHGELKAQVCDSMSDFKFLSGIYDGLPVAKRGGTVHNIYNLGCPREYFNKR